MKVGLPEHFAVKQYRKYKLAKYIKRVCVLHKHHVSQIKKVTKLLHFTLRARYIIVVQLVVCYNLNVFDSDEL